MKLKKALCAALLLCMIAALFCACGKAQKGDVSAVERTIPQDAKYSAEEIGAAMDLVERKFARDFRGCTLQKLWYDDAQAQAEAEWAQDYHTDEAIVLLSNFHVSENGGDGSLNSPYDYTNWNWVLVRNNGGKWVLQTWGY